ncbi:MULTISPECIES: hypothetical protein [Streptomyces]|uniref:Integral membrane protein n=1 Tax=Streptomyces koelreuteriae TaxID=2838015 RepID=A0ABX8FUR5_9ACTN|nr:MULTISPECIES: hypothetical protein [Streptomyces]QWB24796.1 hypothetical protein KJK29_20670 [Streptomyces koelreuteriae]UUA07813.1 hypothetical protein NNW98_20785 [Streptomyces koelreuteriae]UUA15442.1 hypothetical protein NNW99_20780 [Streptomyces sp. CRCS-T-1]
MSSRTRARSVKTAAGVHTVRIPRQRGRRSDPFVIVVPERPSLTREALGFIGRGLWHFRRALAPTGLSVLAFLVAGLLHAIAWWSSLVVAPVAAVPVVWLLVMQRRRPARAAALGWRIGLTVLATAAAVWLALAAGFGPLNGSLALLWLLILIAAQTAWLIIRPSH